MSGQRPFAPGWDRPPFGQTSAGLEPPPSFRMNNTRQDQSPIRMGGAWPNSQNSPDAQTPGSAAFPASSSRLGSHNLHIGGANSGMPTPNTSFEEHFPESPFVDGDRLFNMGRDIGRLEIELHNAKEKSKHFESEAARLRKQRDVARSDFTASTQKIEALQRQLDEARSSPRRTTSFITPEKRSIVPFRRPSTQSSASSGSIVGGGVNMDAFSPLTSSGTRKDSKPATPRFAVAALQRGSTSSTPLVMPAKLAQRTIRENFADFFRKTEIWAHKYAVLRPSGGQNDAYTRTLKARCQGMCKARDVDELLEDDGVSRYLVAAVINKTLSLYFGPECLEGFDFAARTTLNDVVRRIGEVRPQNVRAQHQLLEQKACLYQEAINDQRLESWLDGRTTEVLDDLYRLLQPLIPEPGQPAARIDLRRIVKEAFGIGQLMVTAPREWGIAFAHRGERWDCHCMVQRDERLAGDPKLTESNGFAFVVRLGVAPSITEKDSSTGSMNLQTLHPRAVLLIENANQKTTPQSHRKGSGF